MRKVIYCLFLGLLILFSNAANQAATEESSGPGQNHADSPGYPHASDGRLAESATFNPKRSITGMLAGVGLIGFVMMNAKRKNRG